VICKNNHDKVVNAMNHKRTLTATQGRAVAQKTRKTGVITNIRAAHLRYQDRQKMFDLMHSVSSFLQRAKIRFCLAFGTLLGAVRDGEILKHDDDVDFFFEAPAIDKLRKLPLKDSGLALWVNPLSPTHCSLSFYKDRLVVWPFVELFPVSKHGNPMQVRNQQTNIMSAKELSLNIDFDNLIQVPMNITGRPQIELPSPRDPHTILDKCYPNWRTEIRGLAFHKLSRAFLEDSKHCVFSAESGQINLTKTIRDVINDVGEPLLLPTIKGLLQAVTDVSAIEEFVSDLLLGRGFSQESITTCMPFVVSFLCSTGLDVGILICAYLGERIG
jgi:hypothetical protein